MPTIELTNEEAGTLREALESYLSDLHMEIADTDSREFRDGLKAKETVLKSIVARLGA